MLFKIVLAKMFNYQNDDTIAAIATPIGEGAIAIVRLSGKKATQICAKIFSKNFNEVISHQTTYGKIYNLNKELVDAVMLVLMKAPKSYTGEDLIEIHCHGGSYITKQVLDTLIQAGARHALPGEFTYRAYKNKKIDLAQAEAVQELIGSKNALAKKSAADHLIGILSTKIKSFQKQLVDLAAILEAWVDFPEEDLEFLSKDEFLNRLDRVKQEMQKLADTYDDGKILFQGICLSIIGTPNVGKSSLMNMLLKKERAIVTSVAGTTRDILEDYLHIGSLHFKLIDTAGLRDTDEEIEKEGIKRSYKAYEDADIVLLVLDSSRDLSTFETEFLQKINPEKTLIVWNKIDLAKPDQLEKFPYQTFTSAKNHEGIDLLKQQLEKIIWKQGAPSKDEILISQERHKLALDTAISYLSSVKQGLQNNLGCELLCEEIKGALKELSTIIGSDVTEDILSSIFSQFCLGK